MIIIIMSRFCSRLHAANVGQKCIILCMWFYEKLKTIIKNTKMKYEKIHKENSNKT